MFAAQMPGPGDEITWPACVGHPCDPRTEVDEDPDVLNEDSAMEIAKDENEQTPAHFADWLAKAADNGNSDRTPQDMNALRATVDDGDCSELTTGQLVALLVAASQSYAVSALYELRERFEKSAESQEYVQGRVAELLAAQDEQDQGDDEGAHYDRLAAIYAGAM